MGMQKRYITTADASLILGVNSSRVRQLIGAGRIKTTKFGSVHLIEPSALKGVMIRSPGRPKILK